MQMVRGAKVVGVEAPQLQMVEGLAAALQEKVRLEVLRLAKVGVVEMPLMALTAAAVVPEATVPAAAISAKAVQTAVGREIAALMAAGVSKGIAAYWAAARVVQKQQLWIWKSRFVTLQVHRQAEA